MRLIRVFALTVLIIASLSIQSVSQVTDVKVQIINSLPKVLGVQSSGVTIGDSSSIVWCSATIEDLNSYRDIKSQSAFVGVPSSGGYVNKKNPDFFKSEQTSIVRGLLTAGFVIDSKSPPGTYACVVEDVDTADDKGVNQSTFTIAPASCENKIKDALEENTDCGGACLPCSCFNGVMDTTERGVDCGGECVPCQDQGGLTISTQDTLIVGEILPIQVKYGNKPMYSLIRVTKPSGKMVVFSTDDSGVLNLPTDETGSWKVQADLMGYKGSEAQVQVKSSITSVIIIATLIAVIIILILLILRKRKKAAERPKELMRSL